MYPGFTIECRVRCSRYTLVDHQHYQCTPLLTVWQEILMKFQYFIGNVPEQYQNTQVLLRRSTKYMRCTSTSQKHTVQFNRGLLSPSITQLRFNIKRVLKQQIFFMFRWVFVLFWSTQREYNFTWYKLGACCPPS